MMEELASWMSVLNAPENWRSLAVDTLFWNW